MMRTVIFASLALAGVAASVSIVIYALTRKFDGHGEFKFQHLFRRVTWQASSRTQLLVEAAFLLILALVCTGIALNWWL